MELKIVYVPIEQLKPSEYNPRRWNKTQMDALKESIQRFSIVDPVIANSAPERMNVLVGGHMRLKAAKELGMETVPVAYINLPDMERERELNLRLNKNSGEFDFTLLRQFNEEVLKGVGFSSEELDEIFQLEEKPEKFDIEKALKKAGVDEVTVQKGDVYELDGSKVMCGDSTISDDVQKLMDGEKADMVLTDPPYLLDYLRGKKRHGKATTGFGLKRDRRYLETESLPENFTELWMANVATAQQSNFSIIVFENPKNLRTIWNALEKHWKYRNTIIWHVPNRVQGFSARHKFFNKYDFAILGTSGKVSLNDEPESDELLQNEYEAALFATSGKPHWESYEKGKAYCPTDFIEHIAADEKSSGQSVVFGTKPVEILLPYLKVLTKRDALVLEPFGGSGSTLIAALKLKRRCYLMEKSPVYTAVILARWEKFTGQKAAKVA